MRIDSSGNVGIGTTSPASPLAVMGDTSADIPSAGSPSSHFAVGMRNDQYRNYDRYIRFWSWLYTAYNALMLMQQHTT